VETESLTFEIQYSINILISESCYKWVKAMTKESQGNMVRVLRFTYQHPALGSSPQPGPRLARWQ
jgi:hypothetical protein